MRTARLLLFAALPFVLVGCGPSADPADRPRDPDLDQAAEEQYAHAMRLYHNSKRNAARATPDQRVGRTPAG